MNEHVETLIKKAADAHSADDAMKFSQAACNAANALRALADVTATNAHVAKQ